MAPLAALETAPQGSTALVLGRDTPRPRYCCLLAPRASHSHETASTRTERLIGLPRAGCKMKLSIALLAAPALAFAPVAQQRASVKVEYRVEKITPC